MVPIARFTGSQEGLPEIPAIPAMNEQPAQEGYPEMPGFDLYDLLVPIYDPTQGVILPKYSTVSDSTLIRCVPGIVFPDLKVKGAIAEAPQLPPTTPTIEESKRPLVDTFESVFIKQLNLTS